ncbi:MAG TPA: glycosyl hydrolase family 65 protein [Candidatus Binatia bacterium]|nr:glycosyl hydrolase family 65 protein [Candidatus Binatia bacterium]
MTGWSLVYDDFNPGQQKLREALCTLGNGYFATRGAAEEARADEIHYPGTYLAAAYNRLETEISGEVIENEDLVNFPNWLSLTFRIEDGDWLNLRAVDLLSYRQELDMKRGMLLRTVRIRDATGKETEVASRRIVHMADPHLAAIDWTATALNWFGRIRVRSALDGRVTNSGVERYRQLNGRHLNPLRSGRIGEDSILLVIETNQSRLQMAQATRTRALSGSARVIVDRHMDEKPGWVAQEFDLELDKETPIRIEKVISLYSSRDRAISECALEAESALGRAGSFEALLETHVRSWEDHWSRCDIYLEGPERTERLLRFHIFHLLQTVSMNTIDLDVGVPPRGWHGEAYRGHILWDELFIFPFLNLRIPELTRALLLYRYRRLPMARYMAKQEGHEGAMYPWQSGSNGREESQRIHLNPQSGRWIPDNSRRQRHVNAAIAYNIWQYYQATADREFLSRYGAEMLLEIARFWASLAHYNADIDRYEICGVMGPDEYHDSYPGAEEPGLNNNAYTNVMATWTLHCAHSVLDLLEPERLREIREDLNLRDEELEDWKKIARKMRLVFHGEGIISQFEGYGDLEEFQWEKYRRQYGDIHRLDRILEAEGDTPNRYKLSKQADVLMLFHLFSAEELASLFDRFRYPFDSDTIPKNVDYYLKRTAHGSTLSRVVHSWVLARSDRPRSWKLFAEALESDVSDIQGGTTAEGIHLGAMAGTVDLIQRGYTGIEMRDDVLWLNPCIPKKLEGLTFKLTYRSHWLDITIRQDRMKIGFRQGWARRVKIGFRGEVYEFEQGDTKEFALEK